MARGGRKWKDEHRSLCLFKQYNTRHIILKESICMLRTCWHIVRCAVGVGSLAHVEEQQQGCELSPLSLLPGPKATTGSSRDRSMWSHNGPLHYPHSQSFLFTVHYNLKHSYYRYYMYVYFYMFQSINFICQSCTHASLIYLITPCLPIII